MTDSAQKTYLGAIAILVVACVLLAVFAFVPHSPPSPPPPPCIAKVVVPQPNSTVGWQTVEAASIQRLRHESDTIKIVTTDGKTLVVTSYMIEGGYVPE
jgi:hypothetical protein